MKYKVVFTKRAIKELKKIDKLSASLIMGWIDKNLEGCSNPRLFGKALKGPGSGKWRYRVGDYRIIANIDNGKIIILILNIGHRKDIYKKVK